MYAILGTNQLPDLRGRFLEGSDIGNTVIEAGLPNITAKLGNYSHEGLFDGDGGLYTNGAFTVDWSSRSCGLEDYNFFISAIVGLNFNASLSSPIYGNSTTVQPPAITVRYYIRAK